MNALEPSVLVRTNSYYRNWTAPIDGKSAHIGRVDDVVRGIVVPRGRSTVVFRYHSAARSLGEVISYATAGALALFVLGATLRRRRARA